LDKDVSVALGQNVRDVLRLKICLKVCGVILENPEYPLTFYTCIDIFIRGQNQQPE